MQTIRRRASRFQSAIDIISKQFLSPSDIKEACNIVKAEGTSLSNDRNILVSHLRQLVQYYTKSYTLKGLEGNILSGPNNNITSSPNVLVDFSPLFEKNTNSRNLSLSTFFMYIWQKYRGKHVRYDKNVLKFYQVIESMGR